jgi:hypothetical protein
VLVARLRPENPRGTARITYDDRDTVFVLEGVGEITSAKLLDLENRQQLVWLVDEQTRVQVRAAAMLRARQDAAARTAVRTRRTTAGRTVPHGTRAGETAPAPTDSSGGRPVRAGRAARPEAPVVRSPRPGAIGSPARRRLFASVVFAAITCAVVVSAGALGWNKAAGFLATTPATRETRYTELYFTNPAALPTSLAGAEPGPISFTVFNHEGHRQVYSYTVRLAGPSGSSLVARGSMDLGSNTGRSRFVRLAPIRVPGTYSVSVTVAEPHLSISFTGTS